jgi:hypothetical protein
MVTISHKALAAFAFKQGASFIGGKPANDVLKGNLGVLVFMFTLKHKNNFFIMWVRENFDAVDYQEKILTWKGKKYQALFLHVPQVVSKKFLLPFRQFVQSHYISF